MKPSRVLKRIGQSDFLIKVIGRVLAGYLRLVYGTSRFAVVPEDIYDKAEADFPIIIAMWHGQHFMVPFIRKPKHKVSVLISKHRDGEINAIAAQRLGIGTIRGSGDTRQQFVRKGGAVAFREMLRALGNGTNIALTADVPKGPARRAGFGIITLAHKSGRPIYPLATATSRRIEMNSWDRAAVNLPFSKGVFLVGEPIEIPADTDDEALEGYRLKLEEALNQVTERAYEIVDGTGGS